MLGSTPVKQPLLQLPPVPEELKEWAQDTTLATFAGMLLGGLQQWLEERRAGEHWRQAAAGLMTQWGDFVILFTARLLI